MVCTKLFVTFNYRPTPPADWFLPWQQLATLVEKHVDPIVKEEVIAWYCKGYCKG